MPLHPHPLSRDANGQDFANLSRATASAASGRSSGTGLAVAGVGAPSDRARMWAISTGSPVAAQSQKASHRKQEAGQGHASHDVFLRGSVTATGQYAYYSREQQNPNL